MIVNADAFRIPLPDGVVQCVVTSPPYWGLRAYSGEQERVWDGAADCEHEWETHRQAASGGRNTAENPPNTGGSSTQQAVPNPSRDGVTSSFCQRCGAWRGGLGLEPTPEMFIEHLVQVFREIRRVMRDDAVAWANMGDCFNDKQLVMVPHRLALVLQADGWWVRSDVAWSKPNPMPESLSGWGWEQCKVKTQAHADHEQALQDRMAEVGGDRARAALDVRTDRAALDVWEPCTGCPKCRDNDGLVLRRGSWRPTSAHEYVFMLAKSSTYFSDGEAVREANKPESIERDKLGWKAAFKGRHTMPGEKRPHSTDHTGFCNPAGRNLRSVWNISTQPFKGAHYATFPTALAQRCVLASTSRHACAECGAPHVRVVEKTTAQPGQKPGYNRDCGGRNDGERAGKWTDHNTTTLAHRPSCGCGAGVRPCIVLDPFCGSGTVGQVCRELPHRRDFVGLDLSFEYLQDQALVRSERRTPPSALAELPMFA